MWLCLLLLRRHCCCRCRFRFRIFLILNILILITLQFTILIWNYYEQQEQEQEQGEGDDDHIIIDVVGNTTTTTTTGTSSTSSTTSSSTTTTETIIMIPQNNDGRPDPNVWKQLSKAWTDMNGTDIRTKNGDILKNKDKHLSKLQQQQQQQQQQQTNNGTFCSPTSLLQLKIITTTTTTTTASANSSTNNNTTSRNSSNSNSNNSSTWILTSYDSNGNIKTIGGDEFYITYSDDQHQDTSTTRRRRSNNNENNNNSNHYPNNNNNNIIIKAVAYSIDRGDGTYLLDFVSPPTLDDKTTASNSSATTTKGTGNADVGFLTIHFQYTCGIGSLPHGTKQKWRTGGSLMITYPNIPVPKLLLDSNNNDIRSFVIPNNNNILSHSKKQINLGQYTKVIMYGDSNLQYLFLANNDQYPNLKFTSRPESSLNKQSMKRKFLPKITWFVNDTIIKISNNNKDNNNNNNKIEKYALIIGSSCWDIVFGKKVGPKFIYHLIAMKELLEELQQQRFLNNNTVDIYWHSGYALHIHVASSNLDWDNYREPLKYMSYSRSYQLYKQQIELCQQLNITVLDFMDATYLLANHYQYGDSRHVEPYISKLLLSWYYPK